MKYQTHLLVSLMLVISSLASHVYAFTPKAKFPLLVEITPVDALTQTQEDLGLNRRYEFTVVVTSAVLLDAITVQVQLPAEVELDQGDLQWQGSLSPNTPLSLNFTVLAQTGKILLLSAMVSNAQQKLIAKAEYQQNPKIFPLSSALSSFETLQPIKSRTVFDDQRKRLVHEYRLD